MCIYIDQIQKHQTNVVVCMKKESVMKISKSNRHFGLCKWIQAKKSLSRPIPFEIDIWHNVPSQHF